MFYRRKVAIPPECADMPIETQSSICTGETLVGFRHPVTKELRYAELVMDDRDVEKYKKKYGK